LVLASTASESSNQTQRSLSGIAACVILARIGSSTSARSARSRDVNPAHAKHKTRREANISTRVRTRPSTFSMVHTTTNLTVSQMLSRLTSHWTDLNWNSLLYMRTDVPLDADQSPASTDMHVSPPSIHLI
ncbi:hypothetical protein KCU74_g103, partial [Aureobasidium melanogenum]